MDTQQSKRGLIIGAIVFAFLVFAGGVGLWLFNRNTDNRSQAAAEPVAAVKIISQKDAYGEVIHNVMIDVSQMKAGTTVTDFSSRIFVPVKTFTPPEQTPMPKPSVMFVTPTMVPKPSVMFVTPTAVPSPYAQAVTPTPVGYVSGPSPTPSVAAVLGVSTEQLAALPPGYPTATVMPSRTVTKEQPMPTAVVQRDYLAQSQDRYLTVKGLNQYTQLQNLKVTITTFEKGYLIELSGQAASTNATLQQAFSKPQPLFAILPLEKNVAMGTPEVQTTSIKGYLPGLKTVVELTKQEARTITTAPTTRPPVVVSTCKSTRDCPHGYVCKPPVATCPPGRPCTQVASWQCVRVEPTLARPTPRITVVPSYMRRPVIIKTIN